MSHADDCVRVIEWMVGHNKPATLDEINRETRISFRVLNQVILDLRLTGQVTMESTRVKGQGKVNLYSIKASRS